LRSSTMRVTASRSIHSERYATCRSAFARSNAARPAHPPPGELKDHSIIDVGHKALIPAGKCSKVMVKQIGFAKNRMMLSNIAT
jgi:hypothetical protein